MTYPRHSLFAIVASAFLCTATFAHAQPARETPAPEAVAPWTNRALEAGARADLLLAAMTQEEKLSIVTAYWGSPQSWTGWEAPEGARHGSAGFAPGIARLGIPPQWQADAGMGVAQQGGVDHKTARTGLPSGVAVASSWDPEVAFSGGAMIGSEARASGFNVLLAGGVNLLRDPRNGRNFEYAGEDPLLAGRMAGAAVRGVQSNHIISTVKHYALNDQETWRSTYSVVIDESAARMSDLLAFEIALEESHAGSVMCSYNRYNGQYACENAFLLNDVLKRDWGWQGYVMSDWGATHSTVDAAINGLDQQTGVTFAPSLHYGNVLGAAISAGQAPQARLDDMARRILYAMFSTGLYDNPVPLEVPDEGVGIDVEANARVSQHAIEQGAVLLRNEGGVLPLASNVRSIAVIGAHADVGVITGGGSSQVYPRGGNAAPGVAPTGWPGPVMFIPDSPLAAIRAHAPGANVRYASGEDARAAARLARDSDIAIVFATQWTSESEDFAAALSGDQDALIAAIARANRRTIVVLETGGPVLMPWIENVAGVLEAWYPGERGGQAIANILFGDVNPSGHLTATFARDLAQLPHADVFGRDRDGREVFDVTYSEGATVGYKWFDAHGLEPLFPFGFGLSYTSFAHDGLRANVGADGRVTAEFTLHNTGARAGADVAQIYVEPVAGGWEAPKRLGGWAKMTIAAGGSAQASVTIDPRIFAMYDAGVGHWRIAPGQYRIWLGASARDLGESVLVTLPETTFH